MSRVRIISANEYAEEIVASAGRMSTTEGSALRIFADAKTNEKNADLIKKVTSSGHTSVLEHATFTLAFDNVSVVVEQFMIEHRLTSPTVKSRRYVDFTNQGFYIPHDLKGDDYNIYCDIMHILFQQYQVLLDNGAPKEDARFLLPYSFHSNFYCTLNARELQHIIHNMKFGYGHGKLEFEELADQLISQLNEKWPWAVPDLHDESDVDYSDIRESWYQGVFDGDALELIPLSKLGIVSTIASTQINPKNTHAIDYKEDLLNEAFMMNHFCDQHLDDVRKSEMIQHLLTSTCSRELELLNYVFYIQNVSLPTLTHLTRHRMHTLVNSPVDAAYCGYILPSSFEGNSFGTVYTETIQSAYDLIKAAVLSHPNLMKYHYYFLMSANLTDVIMSVNARELLHAIRLRTCNRAQWEVQNIYRNILCEVRKDFPKLFNHYGPSCYLTGKCPEGRLSCGKKTEVIEAFKPDNF